MSKQLFNRNDPKVIASAKECDAVEAFVSIYKETTTATEKTLIQAYYELKHGKMAAIRMMSGSTDNSEPIEPTISTIKNIENMSKTKPTTEEVKVNKELKTKPKRLETHDGEQVMVDADRVEKTGSTEKENAKAIEKANKIPKEKSTTPTKQDKIKELLTSGATSKEIKAILAEDNIKVYDSEILSAKNKLKPQEQ